MAQALAQKEGKSVTSFVAFCLGKVVTRASISLFSTKAPPLSDPQPLH